MSTYWYFECVSHDPPLCSEEFTQHTGDWAYHHGILTAKARPVDPEAPPISDGSDTYFDRNARRFLVDHPNCKLEIVNEYGSKPGDRLRLEDA